MYHITINCYEIQQYTVKPINNRHISSHGICPLLRDKNVQLHRYSESKKSPLFGSVSYEC